MIDKELLIAEFEKTCAGNSFCLLKFKENGTFNQNLFPGASNLDSELSDCLDFRSEMFMQFSCEESP